MMSVNCCLLNGFNLDHLESSILFASLRLYEGLHSFLPSPLHSPHTLANHQVRGWQMVAALWRR